MYCTAVRYSRSFKRRASAPVAPDCGVYWLMSEKSTVFGGKWDET